MNWAYAREKVHLARPQGSEPAPRSRAPRAGCADSSDRCGAMISTSLNLGFEAPADAYAVAWAVESVGRMARVVREYGLIGSRPDWTPRPVITVERGKTGYTLEIVNRKRRPCAFRMVRFAGDLPAIVEERRRAYSAWARAIALVHARLAEPGALAAHNLSGDLPPISPWAG
ncbi:MAG TPA: hypothetical protein VGM17_02340 [Rhizomicrobium sp.]